MPQLIQEFIIALKSDLAMGMYFAAVIGLLFTYFLLKPFWHGPADDPKYSSIN